MTTDPAPDLARRELTAQAVIPAPRERVWAAWTDPQQLENFFGPVGVQVPAERIELDPRPGGAFGVTFIDPAGGEHRSTMSFREIAAPERLVYGWEAQRGVGGGQVSVTLTESGQGTEVRYHFTGETTAAGLDYLQGVAASTLERLAAVVTDS